MPRLSTLDRARARGIQETLGTVVIGAPPVLEALMPDLGDYLGTPKACSYGVSVDAEGCDIRFGYGVGFPSPTAVVEGMGRWVRASRGRWGLYDAARVERAQQNQVVETPNAQEVVAMAEAGVDGMDAAEAGREVHETLGTLEDYQLRILVCDGHRLLAWVGGLQPEPFSRVQRARLRALVPALRRRLLLESRLETAALAEAALPVILDRIPGAAFVVSGSGAVRLANAAGRARYDRNPRATCAAIRRALADPRSANLDVTPLGIDGGPPCFLVIERSRPRSPGPAIAAAARRYGLTPRETEVLGHLVQGASNRAIALELGCAERTVEVHVAHLLDKVGAPSRSALVARFWMDG